MYDTLIKQAITYGLNETSCPLGRMLIAKIQYGDTQSVPWLQQLIKEYEDKQFEGDVDIYAPFRPEIVWPGGDLPIFSSAEKLTPIALESMHLDKGGIIASATGVGKSTVLKLLGEQLPACLTISQKHEGLFEGMQTNPTCIYVGSSTALPDPFTTLPATILAGLIRTILERHDSAVLFQHIHARLKHPTLANIIAYLENPEKSLQQLFRKDLFLSLYASLYELHTDALGCSLAQNQPMQTIPDHCFVCTALCSKKAGAFYTAALMEMVKAQKEKSQNSGMHAIIVDEASELVQEKYNTPSPLNHFVRMARGSSIPVILGIHSLQVCSSIILSNVFTTLILRTVNDKDIDRAARLASLTRSQQDVIPKLPIGHGILRVANVSQPVIVTWRHVLPGVPKALVRLPQPMATTEVVQLAKKQTAPVAKQASTSVQPVILETKVSVLKPPAEFDLLTAIAVNPYMGLTELCRNQNYNWRHKKVELESLVKQRLVETIPFHLSTRGKPPEWLFVTADGYRALNQPIPTSRGGTGIAHTLIQVWVKDQLTAEGLTAEIEKHMDGKAVDVAVGTVAIEVCLSTTKTECAQAKLDLQTYDQVIILCPNKAILQRMEKQLAVENASPLRVTSVLPKDLIATVHEKLLLG